MNVLGHPHDFVEDPVDSVADANSPAIGLHVNITRPVLDPLLDDHIDDADDGRFFLHHGRPIHILLSARSRNVELLPEGRPHSAVESVQRGLQFLLATLARSIRIIQQRANVLDCGQNRIDLIPRYQPHIVQSKDIARVGHGHREAIAAPTNGDGVVPLYNALGNGLRHVFVDARLVELEERDAELLCVRSQHIPVGHVAEIGQYPTDLLGRILLYVQRLIKLLLRDDSLP